MSLIPSTSIQWEEEILHGKYDKINPKNNLMTECFECIEYTQHIGNIGDILAICDILRIQGTHLL